VAADGRALAAAFPETALVTGGASGIGRAAVELLERQGARVQSLDLVSGFDVGDPGAWESVGPVELAFLNAGLGLDAVDVTEIADAEYRRVLGANVDGVFFGVRRLARVMQPGSSIVVTASLAGLVPLERNPLYALTKHAVVGFVRSVERQLARRGIRINAVAPGYVDTPLLDRAGQRAAFEAARFPLLEPEEVAAAVLVAARSEQTGQAWVVQPGREALQFRFPNVPGPRAEGGAGRLPPL
jgi:NAD(P)-dependent dehydrogenase (short-subunit alcohol dehydrogenase family)